MELGQKDCDVRQYMHMLPFRVEYIGQTKQPWKKTNRLTHHHRIPEIRHDLSVREPGRGVWILLMNFSSKEGRFVELDSGDMIEEVVAEHNATLNAPYDEMVNAIEAALIALFDAHYNKTFRDSFPDSRHKSYKWYYQNAITSIGVAFSGAKWGIQLHGYGRDPQLAHAKRFRLGKTAGEPFIDVEVPMTLEELQSLAYHCG